MAVTVGGRDGARGEAGQGGAVFQPLLHKVVGLVEPAGARLAQQQVQGQEGAAEAVEEVPVLVGEHGGAQGTGGGAGGGEKGEQGGEGEHKGQQIFDYFFPHKDPST